MYFSVFFFSIVCLQSSFCYFVFLVCHYFFIMLFFIISIAQQCASCLQFASSERLRRLNLPTLRYRRHDRHRGDMIEVFKIGLLHKIYDIEITERLLQLSNNTTTRGHSLKLCSQPSSVLSRHILGGNFPPNFEFPPPQGLEARSVTM